MALAMTMLAALVSLVLFPAMLIALLLGIMCTSLLMRNIDLIVPVVFHEIDGMAAGVVLAAVLAPVLGMTGWYMHIDWLINDADRYGMNHDGSCVDEFRLGKTPDVHAAVKAGLGYADRDPDVGRKCS